MARFFAQVRRFFAFWVELILVGTVLGAVALGVFFWRNKLDRSPEQLRALASDQQRTSDGTAYWWKGNRGPNLVLVHGFLGSKATFEPLVPHLSGRYRMWAYDRKGQGYTKPDGDLGLGGQVEQLRRFVTELKLSPIVLLGHGYGGGVAQAYAAKYPTEVKHLILVDTIDFLDDDSKGTWESTDLRNLLHASLQSPYFPQVMPHLSGRLVTAKLLSHWYANPNRIPESTILSYAYPMAQPGYWDRLSEMMAPPGPHWIELLKGFSRKNPFPVTILWGINDPWYFPRVGQRMCQRFRTCTFLFVEEAGHLPQEEQPERFAQRLESLIL